MTSKFSQALLQAKQAPLALPEHTEQAAEAAPIVVEVPSPAVKRPNPEVASAPKAESVVLVNGIKGKRSNADYIQVNVYLKKETTHKAKIALLQTMDDRDFSELVEDLVSTWVNQAKS